jgi:hypothetical protein
MKIVRLSQLPICDICEEKTAEYDGPTLLGRHGYMCKVCYIMDGIANSSITVKLELE